MDRGSRYAVACPLSRGKRGGRNVIEKSDVNSFRVGCPIEHTIGAHTKKPKQTRHSPPGQKYRLHGLNGKMDRWIEGRAAGGKRKNAIDSMNCAIVWVQHDAHRGRAQLDTVTGGIRDPRIRPASLTPLKVNKTKLVDCLVSAHRGRAQRGHREPVPCGTPKSGQRLRPR